MNSMEAGLHLWKHFLQPPLWKERLKEKTASLEGFNFVDLVGIRVDNMNPASHTGIK